MLQFGLASFTPFALYTLAIDLQGVLDGALVLGLEGVGTGFAQGNCRGGKLELALLDDDSLECPARGDVLLRSSSGGQRGTVLPSSARGSACGRLARAGRLARGGGSAACPTAAATREHEGESRNRECALQDTL